MIIEIVLLVFGILIGVIFCNVFATQFEIWLLDSKYWVITPWKLKTVINNISWLECWFWTIIFRILNPIVTIIYFIYWIIKKLFCKESKSYSKF